MKEKKILRVDSSSSKKIGGWKTFYQIFGWLLLVGGIITMIVGIVKASEILYPETTTLYVGISLIVTSLVFFFNTALLRGIGTLVENAEYQKAIVEIEYKIQDIDAPEEVKSPAQIEREKALGITTDTPASKFSTGQFVAIKETGEQFRITDITQGNDGSILYYSGKFNKYFTEDDIESLKEPEVK